MKLRDWLDKQRMTREGFAALIGTDHSTVTRYVHGRMPKREILNRIVSATDGEVTANDFLADEPVRRVG